MNRGDLLTRAIVLLYAHRASQAAGSLAQDPVANAGDAEDVGLIP